MIPNHITINGEIKHSQETQACMGHIGEVMENWLNGRVFIEHMRKDRGND